MRRFFFLPSKQTLFNFHSAFIFSLSLADIRRLAGWSPAQCEALKQLSLSSLWWRWNCSENSEYEFYKTQGLSSLVLIINIDQLDKSRVNLKHRNKKKKTKKLVWSPAPPVHLPKCPQARHWIPKCFPNKCCFGLKVSEWIFIQKFPIFCGPGFQ